MQGIARNIQQQNKKWSSVPRYLGKECSFLPCIPYPPTTTSFPPRSFLTSACLLAHLKISFPPPHKQNPNQRENKMHLFHPVSVSVLFFSFGVPITAQAGSPLSTYFKCASDMTAVCCVKDRSTPEGLTICMFSVKSLLLLLL